MASWFLIWAIATSFFSSSFVEDKPGSSFNLWWVAVTAIRGRRKRSIYMCMRSMYNAVELLAVSSRLGRIQFSNGNEFKRPGEASFS